MTLRRKRRRPRNIAPTSQPVDRSERFLIRKSAGYLYRHLQAFPYMVLDEDFFELLAFGINQSLDKVLEVSLEQFDGQKHDHYWRIIQSCLETNSRFTDIIPCVLERAPKGFVREIHRALVNSLADRMDNCRYRGLSELEKNLQRIKEVFSLTDPEAEFAIFLYGIGVNSKLEGFFVDELHCQSLTGRKYLGNALGLTRSELEQVLNGTLKKIGFFEMDSSSLDLNPDFTFLFEGAKPSSIAEAYFRKVKKPPIPLSYHLTVQRDLQHVLKLLEKKPLGSTHILIYGPPGTGKSSFAEGLAKELGLPAYQILKNEENTSIHSRAAIRACLNLTNTGGGSLILVDEADNLLNTSFSWFFRGETQDKGWLNQLMEEAGVRMLWITNEIDQIAPSVLRRFAFSLEFKSFNKVQRLRLWENILSRNKARGLIRKKEISEYARKYQVSAGAIDLAVKKAIETQKESREGFQGAVTRALEAHRKLLNQGQKPPEKDQLDPAYSLEGLNIKGDLEGLMGQLEGFDQYLRTPEDTRLISLNLLFHGAPGTGKSELAKYIGQRLDRETLRKRASDLHSKWVGETEKNIREAFEEAEREGAVLVIDEADSFLFSRERAERSWEISFTNEFLTQMEGYRGILICTTNRLLDLDQASIRRFQEKLEFDYLDPEGNLIFYGKFLEGLVKGPLQPQMRARLRRIKRLAPGDFKTVRERYRFLVKNALTHDSLLEALGKEAQIKKLFKRADPIGF